MISHDLARALAASGLRWTPNSGDFFCIPGGDLETETFVVSELTIEPREYPTGTILAFNGTTEWALDSVAAQDTLWLPREDQLREALGASFRALRHDGEVWFVDHLASDGAALVSLGASAAEAYGTALLDLLGSINR